MSFQGYNAERQLQQQAVQFSQNEVAVGVQNLQAQALPRMIDDLGIERGLAVFNQRTQALLQVLAIVGGSPISQQAQQTEQSTGVVPGMASLLKGVGGTVLLPPGAAR